MASSRFRFGEFEFDADSATLRRNGAVVRLQAQPKQVLACLLKNADRIVSREELKKTIWGEETFVDFERGLNFCISQIRSVLKDEAADPKFIQTFAKQGYKFIAELERSDPADTLEQPSPVAEFKRVRWGWLSLSATLFVVLTLVAVNWHHLGVTAHERPNVAVVRFDNETQNSSLDNLGDGLSDVLVERLTSLSNGRYSVIGNAQLLRVPRNQRNLDKLYSSLNAKYIVLGQLQANGSQTRILVHLIRMPEQTHIWVARLDRSLGDPMALEAEVGEMVGTDFARRISSDIASKTTAQPGASN